MVYSALLLGSIGVLADTSDLQRRAFNTAFEEAGVDWHWDLDTYARLLKVPGGKARLRHYADIRGHEVDTAAIYNAKVATFDKALDQSDLALRPGIDDLLVEARMQGLKIAFVTGTDPRQVKGVLKALEDELDPAVFDYIGSINRVPNAKPAPDIYNDALRVLDVPAGAALAIEDTPESAAAALGAGVATWGYPSVAEGRDFGNVLGVGYPELALLRGADTSIAAQ